MSRRRSFNSLMAQIARDAAKRQRQAEKYERAKIRAVEQARKQDLKEKALADKEAKQRYVDSRVQETHEVNAELRAKLLEFSKILEDTITINDTISFSDLRIHEEFRNFELPNELKGELVLITKEEYFSKVKKPSGLDKLIPGWEKRYQKQLGDAEKLYKDYLEKFEIFATERNKKVIALRDEYDKEKQAFDLKIQQRNQEIDALKLPTNKEIQLQSRHIAV